MNLAAIGRGVSFITQREVNWVPCAAACDTLRSVTTTLCSSEMRPRAGAGRERRTLAVPIATVASVENSLACSLAENDSQGFLVCQRGCGVGIPANVNGISSVPSRIVWTDSETMSPENGAPLIALMGVPGIGKDVIKLEGTP
jgi:hypothetical protein